MTKQRITKVFSVVLAFALCFSICAGTILAEGFKLASVGGEPEINYEKSVDGKTFYIECSNVEDYPICIILALYQGDKLVDIMSSQGYSSQATFTTKCEYDREKVMVWNSLRSLNPIVTSDNVVSPLSTVGKIEGVLVETARNGSLRKNEIEFVFHRDRVYGDDEWMEFINNYFDDYYSDYATACFTLADSLGDVSDFLQLPSVIHFRKVAAGMYEVCAITPGEIGSTVEIVPEDIDSVEASDGSWAYDAICYYPTPTSTKVSKYKIDTTADYYYNYSKLYGIEQFVDFLYEWWEYGADAEITLVENDGDSYYDAVIVKEYTYDVVNAIDEDVSVIEGVCEDIKVELDDEEVNVVMKDADGEEITLDDFSKGDVIAYMSSNGRTKNYDWIEVINFGQNSVTGMVNEVDSANGVVYVDSTEYGIAGFEMPNLGDEGTFYLTKTGKIFFVDTTLDIDYAYVLDAAFTDADFTECWQLRFLTKDNEVVTYDVRDEFKVDGEYMSAKDYNNDFLESFIARKDWEGNDRDKGAHRIVKFKLDSKGRIKEINTVWATQFTDKEYNKDAQVLAADLVDNALVFNISALKSENYYATDISELSDGEEYSGYYITNLNEDNDCVVITKGLLRDIAQEPEELTDMGYAYVLNAAFSDADFTEAWQLLILTEDNEIEIMTVGETITVDDEEISAKTYDCNFLESFEAQVDWEYGYDYDKGAHRIITYSVDDEGVIREINTASYTSFEDEGYDKDSQKLGADLTDDAVIFNISAKKSDNYFATDISCLKDGEAYNGFYVTNANDENDCVAITYPVASPEDVPEVEITDKGYAYVLNAAFSDADFTECWQLLILTQDNEVEILNVGETITVNGEEINAQNEDVYLFWDFEANTDEYGYDYDKGAHRVITYGVDSKNQIREINTADYTNFTDREYDADAQVLGADLTDEAVIFNVSASKSDNYFATDIFALVNGAEYGGAYITNKNGENDCVVITHGGMLIDYTQDLSIIASVTDILIDDGATDALKVKYYTSGDETLKTLIVVLDEDVTRIVQSSYDDILPGSLMMFHANNEGVASAVAVVAYLDYYEGSYVINEDAVAEICNSDDSNEFVYGNINDIKTVSAGKKVETTGIGYTWYGAEAFDGYITVKSSSNAYTYQSRNGQTVIHVGDWRANDVVEGEGFTFIARILNGAVNDIITNSMFIGEIGMPVEPDWGVDSAADSAADEEISSEVGWY